jgi:hypothetical protein
MLNFRVRDLMRCSRNCAPKTDVAEETQDMEGGRFGWVTDPEATGSSVAARLRASRSRR